MGKKMSKQYLMMCDENGIDILNALFKPEVVQFLEVKGMNLNGQNTLNILVTPVLPPLNPAFIPNCTPMETPVMEEPTEQGTTCC